MDDLGEYCRQLEAYLCRKNGGHLVRIVGPAFEKVRGWAEQGVPLKIAFRGIDRCCDRAQARGGRRRPLRIEFCEADILTVFDDWRRALGVATPAGAAGDNGDRAESRRSPLAAHIERSVTRLLAVRSAVPDATFDAHVARIIAELDRLAQGARKLRGEAREAAVARLASLDAELVQAARDRLDPRSTQALRAAADAELAGFASRMPADALVRSRERAFERLLRDELNLPVLTYE